jgi:hypothetical protein
MSNDTALAIITLCLLAMSFCTGALMGSLRRDTEWRRYLRREQSIADQRSAEINSHWETVIK